MKKLFVLMFAFVMVFVFTVSVYAIPITSGLVAYYALDGNALDGSGNGHNGTVFGGGLTYVAGVNGLAARFDGNDYISVADHSDLDLLGGTGTISLYVKSDPAHFSGGLITKESSSSFANQIGYEFVLNGNNDAYLLTSDGTTTNNVVTTAINDNEWYNLTATWGGAGGKMRMYQNGTLIQEINQTIATLNDLSEPMRIGVMRWNTTGIFRYFQGDMDEIAIYDRELSASEVQQLAQPVPEPTTIALLGIGLAGLAGATLRRRLKKTKQ